MIRVAVFDTETSGIPERHGPVARVVEVAAVVVDWSSEGINIVDTWASLVRPKGDTHHDPLAAGALKHNRLTVAEIDVAPPEAYVGQLLESWLVNHSVEAAAAYNLDFDFHQQLLGSGFLLGRWLRCVRWLPCLMGAAHETAGHDTYSPGGTLVAMCDHFDVPLSNAHEALADATAAAHLLPKVLTHPIEWECISLPRCPMARNQEGE